MRNILKRTMYFLFGEAAPFVVKRIRFLFKRFTGARFASYDLDKKLERYVDYDNGFFVELGAYDGLLESNSLYFELKRGWSGVLIEPSPHNFIACKGNRSPENHIFCNACVSFDYKEKYVDIAYANTMTVSKNLSLDLPDKEKHIKLGLGNKFLGKGERGLEFGALAKTLTQILDESNAPNLIDFLSLDVEGAELDVLKGIDFKRYNFKFMLIEIRNFERIDKFLTEFGYHFIEKLSFHDYLFEYQKTH